MESNYEQLLKALRLCQFGECGCGKCRYNTLKGDWCTGENHPEFFDCDDKLKLDAAAAIEALEADNAILRQHIDDLDEAVWSESLARQKAEAAQPHWVSVEERLPEPNKLNKRGFRETYLVRYQWCGDSFAVARWNGRYWILGEHSQVIKNVTHWMPIEPPKEDA